MACLLEALQHLAKAAVQESAGNLTVPFAEKSVEHPAQPAACTGGWRSLARRCRHGLPGTTKHLSQLVSV